MGDKKHKSKFTRKLSYASTGVLGELEGYNVFGEGRLRLTGTIELNGIIEIQARLESESIWTTIKTITGTGARQSNTVFIDTWDYIRIVCTNFVSTGAVLYMAGFFSGGGVDVTGEIRPSGLQTGGKITEVTIDNISWTALPTTALSARNAICIQNRSGQEIKINYVNTVGYVGMVIDNKGERFYDISDSIIIYARSLSSSAVVTVEEIA